MSQYEIRKTDRKNYKYLFKEILFQSKNIKKKTKQEKKLQKLRCEYQKARKQQDDQDNDEIEEWLNDINYTQYTHQEFLKLAREKCQSLAKKNKDDQMYFVQNYLLEKECEICHKFNDDEHLLLCDFCDDAYHTYCLTPALVEIPDEDEDWACPVCEKQIYQINKQKQSKDKDKQETSDLMEQNSEDYFDSTSNSEYQCCFACKKKIRKKQSRSKRLAQPFETCVKCHNIFHIACFNNEKNQIVCQACSLEVKKDIPKKQSQITQFFSTVKKVQLSTLQNSENQINDKIYLKSPTKEIEVILPKSKNCKTLKNNTFKLPVPISDPFKIKEQRQNFIYALKVKNIIFDDDLRFSNPICPPECNNSVLEPNLQQISNANYQIFQKFKEMSRQGLYPPIEIEEDKIQGFIVRAVDNIPALTLISEYVGEVDFARNHIFDKNDSIMDLLRTSRSSTSLVICPEKYGNLSRFFSGINNSDKKSYSKINIQTIRYNVDGHVRVLLYAKKNIKQSDILYYDYNAGGFGEYPTENFV